jgi:hypothetical protein
MRLRLLLVCVGLGLGANSVQAETNSGLLYQLQSAVTLPSTSTGWDYIKMEPNSSRLFLARDRDGLTVFDVDQSKAITTVKNSVGTNGPLQTLKETARWPVPCNVSKTRWQASTKRILAACVGDKPRFFVLDPATGKTTASVPIGDYVDGRRPHDVHG